MTRFELNQESRDALVEFVTDAIRMQRDGEVEGSASQVHYFDENGAGVAYIEVTIEPPVDLPPGAFESEHEIVVTGSGEIATERLRQLATYPDEHDDKLVHGELARAAMTLLREHLNQTARDHGSQTIRVMAGPYDLADAWGLVGKNRGSRVDMLTIAGALIAAEIDRLNRL